MYRNMKLPETVDRALLYKVLCMVCVVCIVLYALAPKHKPGASSFTQNYVLTFSDYEGHKIGLLSYRLKRLIVFSWATWSPYSEQEFRDLLALKSKHGNEVQIVAINRGEPLAEAKAFTDKLHMGDAIVLLLDPEDAYYKSIGGYAMPETLFISPSGDATLHQRGPLGAAEIESGFVSIK